MINQPQCEHYELKECNCRIYLNMLAQPLLLNRATAADITMLT